jgi:predicted dehydrogenase
LKSKTTALIGIGYWGKVHLKYLKKIKNILIHSIFYKKNKDIYKDKSINGFNLTNNIDQILNDKSIEFVDIVTPIITHADLAIRFLRKNKKVLIEKPLIMSKKEEKIIGKLIVNKKNLLVSYPYLFSKSLKYAQKLIRANKLGKLRFVEINIQQCGRFMKYGVNHLLAPHAISSISMFFDINKVKFELKKIIEKDKKCESALILCTIKNNLVGIINLSLNFANNRNKKEFTLFCNKGTIVCDLNDKKKTISSYTYRRIKKKNYTITKQKYYKSNFFDEKNNMQFVLENFYTQNKSVENFKLTKIINNFLNNE